MNNCVFCEKISRHDEVSFRSSMRSENVIHYVLATDLSRDELLRRLKGSWTDRFKKWLHRIEYNRGIN